MRILPSCNEEFQLGRGWSCIEVPNPRLMLFLGLSNTNYQQNKTDPSPSLNEVWFLFNKHPFIYILYNFINHKPKSFNWNFINLVFGEIKLYQPKSFSFVCSKDHRIFNFMSAGFKFQFKNLCKPF